MAEAILGMTYLDGDLGDWRRAAMLHGVAQALIDLALGEVPLAT